MKTRPKNFDYTKQIEAVDNWFEANKNLVHIAYDEPMFKYDFDSKGNLTVTLFDSTTPKEIIVFDLCGNIETMKVEKEPA